VGRSVFTRAYENPAHSDLPFSLPHDSAGTNRPAPPMKKRELLVANTSLIR